MEDAQEGDKKDAFDVHLKVHLSEQSSTPIRTYLKICSVVYFEICIKMHKKCI